MMMGGRLAEDIVFGDITAGASSDIQRATDLARKMVVEWGMSEKLGFMSFGSKNEVFIGRDYQVQNQYSDSTAKIIDEEIKAILDKCYTRAKELLESKRDLLERMTQLLLLEETIYTEEVDELIAGKDSEEISKRLHEKAEKRKEKEEQIRKEQEYIKREKMQALKIKAAEALKNSGVINDAELNKLKEEYDKIVKEKEEFIQGVKSEGDKGESAEEKDSQEVDSVEAKEEKPKTTAKKSTPKTAPKSSGKAKTTDSNKKSESQKKKNTTKRPASKKTENENKSNKE
jgi:hypothetical protein